MDTYTIPATSKTGQPETSPGRADPYRRLAAAVLVQGAKEARDGDIDAAQWLLSEQAEFYAGAVGLSFPHVQKWAQRQAHI